MIKAYPNTIYLCQMAAIGKASITPTFQNYILPLSSIISTSSHVTSLEKDTSENDFPKEDPRHHQEISSMTLTSLMSNREIRSWLVPKSHKTSKRLNICGHCLRNHLTICKLAHAMSLVVWYHNVIVLSS